MIRPALVLVDTSVWVDHLRSGDVELGQALEHGLVFVHPFVIGEIALGHLADRGEILERLGRLPRPPVSDDDEVLALIDAHALMGRGIGYVDAHLLASAALGGLRLWTRDQRLHAVTEELGLA